MSFWCNELANLGVLFCSLVCVVLRVVCAASRGLRLKRRDTIETPERHYRDTIESCLCCKRQASKSNIHALISPDYGVRIES